MALRARVCRKSRVVIVLSTLALLTVFIFYSGFIPTAFGNLNSVKASEWLHKKVIRTETAVDGETAQYAWKNVNMEAKCHHNSSHTSKQHADLTKNSSNAKQCVDLTKWVVMTTSAPQVTVAMKILLNSTDDWCLLVVGEEKGPENCSIVNSRFIYLPPREQSLFPFEIVRDSLNAAFTRRNVGYLYAIKNGAKVILDLDDDAIPIPVQGKYFPIEDRKQSYVKASVPGDDLSAFPHYKETKPDTSESFTWNPYPYFGAKSAWPRGFPSKLLSTGRLRNKATRTTCYPLVQQFLEDCNPDVDPNYYFQRPEPLYFDAHRTNKIVLPRGVFAPYNAQATVHLYEAFWGLLLPKTLSQQVSDVWRSYIVQSLFYLIPDACLMFSPPAVYREKYKQNFTDGRPLYDNAFELIQAMKYLPLQFASFEEAVFKLYGRLSEERFLGEDDVEYVSAWINDLKSVGYEFPRIPDKSKIWTNNTQLCIMFNHASVESHVRLLLAYYLRFFDHIMLIFDGKWEERPPYVPDYVKFFGCDSKFGVQQQECLRICLDQGEPGVDGYMYLADDNFADLTYMNSLPRSEVWFLEVTINSYSHSKSFTKDKWTHWHSRIGYKPFKKIINNLPQEWKQVLIDNIGFPDRIHGHTIADLIYLPKSVRQTMMDVISYIVKTAELHSEIAVPLAVDIAAPRRQVVFPLTGFISPTNKHKLKKFHETISKHPPFLHPLKPSIKPLADLWCQLMAEQMNNFIAC